MKTTENTFRPFKQVPKLIFGENAINRIHELIEFDLKNNYVLFVVDEYFKNKKFKIYDLFDSEVEFFASKESEPKISQIDNLKLKILKNRKGLKPKLIVAIGGGSTMDVGKSLSIIFNNEGSAGEYQGWDLVKNRGVHKIGIPTIAGSGSEASRTAVLTSNIKKMGINSDFSMFDSIILDPKLLKTVPKELFIYSAMDCFIHCVESLQGTFKNELSESIADKALQMCKSSLLGNEINYPKLLTSSYLGGVSIVNSEVGICHALSYGLSLEFDLRHGFANTVVFNKLNEFYPDHFNDFKEIVKKYNIELPKNITKQISESKLDRMIQMTLRMERPLSNALGENWKEIFDYDTIKNLYLKI